MSTGSNMSSGATTSVTPVHPNRQVVFSPTLYPQPIFALTELLLATVNRAMDTPQVSDRPSQLSGRPERKKDTFLTAGILFSLDRCFKWVTPDPILRPATCGINDI